MEMWRGLGINIEAHDGLMGVLEKFYTDIYLSQQNRPVGMEYFDYLVSEIHGQRIKELVGARKAGRKVIGAFCVYVPEELTIAVDAIQVGLCAGADVGSESAEKIVPRNTCALIKAFIGFKLSGLCPYIEASDLVVGETTCDGKKKAYELFGEHVPMYVMEIPQRKESIDRDLWKSEILRFKKELEKLTGRVISTDNLKKAIHVVNNKRKALQRLADLRSADPAPISGRDAILINQMSFMDDPVRFTEKVHVLCGELEKRIQEKTGAVPAGTPRVMLSGCPMAIPNWKVPFVIETSGAVIVGEESCVGTRNFGDLVDESCETMEEMLEALTDRYMQINCACFTPNNERLSQIVSQAKALKADGVIHYAITFCTPYEMEAFKAEKVLRDEGILFYPLSTDYGMEDIEQIKTRVEAFVEMINGRVYGAV